MFNLEKAIKEWRKSLRKNEALEDGYITELESHLRDIIDNGIKEGKDIETAFTKGIKQIGEADTLGEEYYKTDTTHIIKRPPWKESRWMPSLLSNYLKVARRNIFRQKGYSSIIIAGLALGMACSFLLLLWVHHQQSFDSFHKDAENLYRLELDAKTPKGKYHIIFTEYPAGQTLKDNFPEIKDYARSYAPGPMMIKYGDNVFYEMTITGVDPSFLKMFTFPLINGNSETALNQPFSMVLSETTAKKYFGDKNPIGQTVTLNNKYAFLITGIMKDAPQNSSLKSGMLIPFDCLCEISSLPNDWKTNYVKTWISLYSGKNYADINKKLTRLLVEKGKSDHVGSMTPDQFDNFLRTEAPSYMLIPLKDINLYAYLGLDKGNAVINSLKIYLALAFFILLIACINYMNLATARAASRAKEIGLRRTVGAERKNLIIQFFGESILLAFISFIFSLILVMILMPIFNDLMNTQFTVESLFNSEFFIVLILAALFVGIISGSYPALLLSSLSPIKVMRGNSNLGLKSNFFRKALVVFQFCLSAILLIGSIVAYQQLEFMRTKNAGYEKDHLIYIQLRGETAKSYSSLKEELLKSSNVLNVSGSDQAPTNMSTTSSDLHYPGKDPNFQPVITLGNVDYDYIETMKIEMIEGRSFSKLFSADSINAFMVNEEFVKVLGAKSGVGQKFKFCGVNGTVVGVMKNFHYTSAQHKIEPLALIFNNKPKYTVIRLRGGNIPEAVAAVKSVWNKAAPSYPFEYKFFDDDFEPMYKDDERMGVIFKYGAFFAIFIACLGLFGFASFLAEKRTKEIGIRKTLGASTKGIVYLLSKEFVKWVLIANVIASPVAYLLMNGWLQNYAYRISIEWWVFIVAAIITVFISVLTIGYQAVKSAIANPAISLRSE